MRVPGSSEFNIHARYQANARRMNIVSVQRGCVGIAILSFMLIRVVIVVKMMRVMRVPERRIRVRMNLDQRYAR